MLASEARDTGTTTTGGWLAALTEGAAVPAVYRSARETSGDPRLVLWADGSARMSASPASRCETVFDGVLYNRAELEAVLDPRPAIVRVPRADAARVDETDADLVRLAYERWGEDFVHHINGIFALVVWDGSRNVLFAVRDRLGSYPLFYANSGGNLVFSTDAATLVETPGVPTDLNRLALADHLCHRWPDPQETYFAAVRRVPPAHVLRVGKSGERLRRYWDPAPPGEPVRWLTESEAEGFDHALDQAVSRCLDLGRTGIFLSGGFDSVSVAAVTADNARRRGMAAPLALSLAFPEPDCNEEPVQRAVAGQLGLPQEMLTFDAAVGPKGLLPASLEMAASWPVPMFNFWNPAYAALTRIGVRRGCQAILTGNGGDEWLGVSPYLSADLIRSLDIRGLVHYLVTIRRSFHGSRFSVLRGGLWTFGVRPLLSAALGRVAPRAWRASRVRRLVESTPRWISSDPALRAQMAERAARTLPDPNPAEGFYLQDARTALEHPLMAIDLEETFEMGRRTGVRFLHPYWDADLVDLLHRVPPRYLNRGGRSKGLVRHAMARRFPHIGFERHKKVAATSFFRRVLAEQGPAAWRAIGRPRALEDLGVVEPQQLTASMSALLSGSDPTQLYRVWDVLALEAWVRKG